MPDRYLELPPQTLSAWFAKPVEVREELLELRSLRQKFLDINDRLYEHLREDHDVPSDELDARLSERVAPIMGQSRTYTSDTLRTR